MDEKVNNFLLAEEKLMPEMHLSHRTYKARGSFTKR